MDAAGAVCPFKNSVNLAYFEAITAQFGIAQTSALIYCDGAELHGLPMDQLTAGARRASLLFNISGHLTLPEVKDKVGCKVYYDDDPGFTQFWHAAHNPGTRLNDHDFYFTIGENIGKPGCSIPTGGLKWRPTRPPIVIEDWPMLNPSTFDRFTTVASWRGAYGPVQHEGKTYGLKVHEFRKFIDSPRRIGQPCEIALQIHPADNKDLEALRANGWRIRDPKEVADSPDAFRRFVQTSSAEFSVAQGIYVDTFSGWFSDRTVRYLASGKPVLVQDTGISGNYPLGEGLFAFRDIDEVVEGAQRIVLEYTRHCRAARRLAEEHFDSNKVIGELAQEIGLRLP